MLGEVPSRFRSGDKVRFTVTATLPLLGQRIEEGRTGTIVCRDRNYPDKEYYDVKTPRRTVERVPAKYLELVEEGD